MTKSREEILHLIEALSGDQVAALRNTVLGAVRVISDGGTLSNASGLLNKSVKLIRVPSVEIQGAELTIGAQISDAASLGTFDASKEFFVVNIGINGYSTNSSLPERLRRLTIPHCEQVEWVRATLGEKLSDYAYRAIGVLETIEPRPSFHIVIIDQHGQPYLAPKDFDWNRIGSGGHSVRPIKSPPAANNTELRAILKSHGDLVPIEEIPQKGSRLGDPEWLESVFSYIIVEVTSPSYKQREVATFTFDNLQMQEGREIAVQFSFFDEELKELRRHGLRVDGPSYRSMLRSRDGDDRPRFAASRLTSSISSMALSYRDVPLIDGVHWVISP
ncbi:hypothetical protein [Rhodococcus ruber]|uniref:hypothetical protein n=1 Tax=Rhodococcus ruber TaxID=1830 RepID=UPI001F17F5ED|nr:hypothetical protein [Rhodococcus ruber]MCF8786832.1 hypothetical protein [Rhodococcus ruber]